MKTRFDFVTNSSSSSFILGFKSREEAIGKISESLSTTIQAYAKLLQDIVDAEPVDKHDLLQRLEDRVEWAARYEVLYGDLGDAWMELAPKGKTRSDFELTKEFKEAVEREKSWMRASHNLIEETPFVIELEYGSDCGYENYTASCELEKILPDKHYVLETISHH